MNNQDIYAKGFKDGWDKCRNYISKTYGLNEENLKFWEQVENFEPTKEDLKLLRKKLSNN